MVCSSLNARLEAVATRLMARKNSGACTWAEHEEATITPDFFKLAIAAFASLAYA